MTREEIEAKLKAGELSQEEADRQLAELDKQKKGDGEGGDGKSYSEAYVKGLREENAKWRKKVREIEERLGKLDGIDPDEYQKLMDEKAKVEREKLEKAGEFDKIKDQLQQGHAKELSKKDEELAAHRAKSALLEAELNSTILENAITIEAAAAKCLNPALLALQIKNEAKIEVTEEGRRVIKLLDAAGTSKFNSKGEPMTIKDRIAEMKQDEAFAMLFEGGIQGAGSGSKGGQGGKFANPWKKDSFNLTKQGELLRNNPELARKLAAEAGKTVYEG